VSDLSDLVEQEHEDPEYIPEILPVDARLSVRGPAATFQRLLERAVSVAPLKEVIFGTSYTLIEAFQNSKSRAAYIRMTATDGDTSISVVADGVVVNMAGSVLVPGKKMLEIIKSAPDDVVRVEVLGNTATVRSGRAQWSVETPLGDQLPPIPTPTGMKLQSAPVAPLMRALLVARFAIPTSGRAALMQLDVHNGYITGADGGRLHRQYAMGLPEDLEMTIPTAVVDELIKQLKNTAEEYVEIGVNDMHLFFQTGEDTLIGKRLLLPFPDLEKQILGPVFSNTYELTVNIEDLTSIVKRVRVNADPDYAAIFLSLQPGPKDFADQIIWSLIVKARDMKGNTAQESMEVKWVGPDKGRELCLNHKYLTDFLKVYKADGKEAVFKIGDDSKSTRAPLFVEDKLVGFTGFIQQIRPEMLR
jgi:DNA polymerase III sliding clamp (beta) subunit (PCNA family)